MTWQWLLSVIGMAKPVIQALGSLPVADLAAEMGDCHKDNVLLGSEIWRNHTERVWFVKCTRCPGASVLRPSRESSEQWVLSHWQSTHLEQ